MFAGPEKPIRCSKLAAIAKCSVRVWMLEAMSYEDDEGGTPAQTGSLVHAGVAAFHQTDGLAKVREQAAWNAIAANSLKFPLADETEVRLLLTPYLNDPRNINARFATVEINGATVPAVELEVVFQLSPHPTDSTSSPIYVTGHLDQIRVENGINKVWDYKSGKKTGWEMLHDYAVQIAGYTHGAMDSLKLPQCEPGGIIRGMGYRTRGVSLPSPDGVFFQSPFKSNHLDTLLDNVRLHVALVRNGDVQFGPGPHCTYCEFGGLINCLPKFEELNRHE
jgi:hypothetical protein